MSRGTASIARRFGAGIAATLLLACAGGAWSTLKDPEFATWESLELDNRAAIWLIERAIAPGTRVDIRSAGTPLQADTVFGIPESAYFRGGGLSTFEKLTDAYDVDNDTLRRIGGVVNAIEVSSWASVGDATADTVEQAYRYLQEQLEHDVPKECYDAFFDALYDVFASNDLDALSVRVAYLADGDERCARTGVPQTARVMKLTIADILAQIAEDERVVFVDVREAAEFEEGHIPNALNVPLRAIDAEFAQSLASASIVVPYCIKDFRGYEAARLLSELGVSQVGTMYPHGIAGWQAVGLPTTKKGLASDAEASEKLRQCAEQPGQCQLKL
jgi:rhodanese-related sulfurtransferase